jgi:BirA family biotin operon repressor/biotin-[acetyl-CoA-carboxylase] ligase
VNVNTARNLLPKGATSLKEELGEDVSRIRLTQKILENLEREYKRLSKGAFEEIAAEWKELSEMLGARVKVELPTREFEGQAIDLDSSGSLLVRLDNGFIEKTSSGDVVLVRRKE